MFYLSRFVLLLLCLIILVDFNFAQKEPEKQIKEIQTNRAVSSSDLFVVVVNKKHGFIDRTGKVAIEPQFHAARSFVEGRAVVGVSGEYFKLGYIDETGKFTVSPQFDNARDFSEGLAAVGIGQFFLHGTGDHKWGFIDKSGKTVIEPIFREAGDFSEGLAAVMNDERKWGYVDKNGKIVVPFQFEEAFSFSEGLACVLTEGLFGFIDKTGTIVIKPQFSYPNHFKEGLTAVKFGDKNTKVYKHYGLYADVTYDKDLNLVDKTGKVVIKLDSNVKKISEFSEGLAVIDIKRKGIFRKELVDKTGKSVFELPFWGYVGKFSEGLAIVERNDKYGFIDKTGKIVIQPEYSYAEDFRNGLARVETGKQIWEFKPLENLGYTPKSGYIDKTGKVIWKPTK